MEPQIQYVQTSDGISIAYYAIGRGPAVLYLMSPWSHLGAEWRVDQLRTAYTASARYATFIRLDPRGFGLSDRDPPDFALDSMVLDIEAVVDALDLPDVRIYALGFANIPALVYTARHPDRVTHLVQTPPMTRDMGGNERIRKLAELAEIDWELATDTIVRTFNPGWPDQQVREFAGLLRRSIDYNGMRRLADHATKWNADAEAASISTPTLLVHDRENVNMDISETRRAAGLIKGSRVAFGSGFQGAALAAQFFFGSRSPDQFQPAPASAEPSSTFRTILFTDLVGHTEMMSRLGDDRGREVLREHERITRRVLKEHGGAEIKTLGDGFMASFGSATRAVQCATALQRAIHARNTPHSGVKLQPDGDGGGGNAPDPISVRIGINAGEPIEEDGDLFGATVILAARIAAKADGGEILVSDTVRGLCSGKGFLFNDRGDFIAKGFEEPVRVYEVNWRE